MEIKYFKTGRERKRADFTEVINDSEVLDLDVSIIF